MVAKEGETGLIVCTIMEVNNPTALTELFDRFNSGAKKPIFPLYKFPSF